MMMKGRINFDNTLILILVLSIVAVPANGTELTVGLYPYVPRLEQFQTAIKTQWAKVQPKVTLKFLSAADWDGGYSNNPPKNVDVYVFDAMFFDYFQSQNWLEPMSADEIDNLDDFVKYAIDGVKVGKQYYAIPQLGCANILFYQKEDEALVKATTLSEINTALSQCTYTSQIPPDRRGLMLDLVGGTTNASLYLDTVHSLTGQYPFSLPWDKSQLNPTALNNLRKLLTMASYQNGTTNVKDYERASWFSQGWGRAFIGYTESMSKMSEETRQKISFKVMPLSDNPNPPLFYADVIAVNTTTHQRGTRNLAVQLANVMAASTTMVASIGPDSDNSQPQYLMATRPSVFQTLASTFPIYNDMYNLIENHHPLMFKVGKQSHEWLTAMKDTIRTNVRQNYSCGCDYPATQLISNDNEAQAICKATCMAHGGWSGQWSNENLPTSLEKPMCSCKACPVSSETIAK